MSPVLNDAELAELLQLDMTLLTRLVEETELPRVVIAGHRRFVTRDVLAWLGNHDVLLAPEAPVEASESEAHAERDTVIVPADEDEIPFVSRNALLSLGQGAFDPAQNLARQQVRDALAGLGDTLHTTLVRLSHDRLHPSPSEADRTSPWRLDEGDSPIECVAMAWAEGEGPPGFADRPRVVLSVTADAVEFSTLVPAGNGAPPTLLAQRARSAGALVSASQHDGPWSITYLYEVARGAPTAAVVQAQLARDAKTLVPVWLGAVGEVETA